MELCYFCDVGAEHSHYHYQSRGSLTCACLKDDPDWISFSQQLLLHYALYKKSGSRLFYSNFYKELEITLYT